jgi:hypothetical protein
MPTFVPFDAGVGMIDKTAVNLILSQGGNGQGSTISAVTAHAGGTQALGVALTTCMINISVCATTGDSVCLPVAIGGQSVYIANSGAAPCNVFSSNASTADTINGTAGTTAFSLVNGKNVQAFSVAAGAWKMLLSA